MTMAVAKSMQTAARLCRSVAVAMIGGVRRRLGHDDTEARIAELSPRDQAVITASALALLFGTALLAAQAGWIGMALFWLAVIVLVG